MKSEGSDLIKRCVKVLSQRSTGMGVGVLRGESLVKSINVLSLIVFLLYIYGMFLHPLLSKFSWSYIHRVWMDWQTLNVGILAFISSVLAFNISRYHVNQQRQREFIAAKSFLPEALSELVSYLKESAKLYEEAWKKSASIPNHQAVLESGRPELPTLYRETFSRNIAHAESRVAAYLAYILVRLQVHHSRMAVFHSEWEKAIDPEFLRPNIKSYLFALGELQALIARLFAFARSETDFINAPLTWYEFETAYHNLNIDWENIEDLENFTKRILDRGNGKGWEK